MKKIVFCFSILSLVLISRDVHTFAQANGSFYLPDHLPELNFDSNICGTTILLGIPEIAEIQLNLQDFSKFSPLQTDQVASATVGTERIFKVYNFEESNGLVQKYDNILFELRAVGDLSEVWVEKEEFGSGKITQAIIDSILNAMENKTPVRSIDPDRGIIEINQDLFGKAPDIDGSGKVKVLLVNIRDGWDPATGGGYIAGFFNPVDLSQMDPNSNKADIIYIDTYPGIYVNNEPANPGRPLSVIAHEYQHLIHANYGNLIVFQNEAQSEFAEVINGFDARNMSFLNDRDEISGNVPSGSVSGLFRWRRSDINALLLDYQRAGLFHGYLNERVGPYATGSITRSEEFGKSAYSDVLEEAGVNWSEFLGDFHVANLLNDPTLKDGEYGYSQMQFSNVRATGIGATYQSLAGESLTEREVSLSYGGAKYTVWRYVEDMILNLSDEGEIVYYAVTRAGASGGYRVESLSTGTTLFLGRYDFIALVAVNTLETDSNEEDPGYRSYSYSTGHIRDPDNMKELVSEYKLAGNFPNPFNPSTTIRYYIPETSHVLLEVFDVTGRKVETLVNSTRSEGSYNEIFHARQLASGLYIYRLQAGDFIRSGKMILTK